MRSFNKYEKKLKDYLEDSEGAFVDLQYCAKLREKSKEFKRQKSLKLYKVINTTKNVDIKKVEDLIASGADVNCRFRDDITLYMLAAINRQVEVLEVLKRSDADVLAKNMYGQDALMLANLMKNTVDFETKKKYLPVLRTLQSHGLGVTKEFDNAGISRDDYYLGNTDPYTKAYLNNIKYYLLADKDFEFTK